MRLLLDTHVFIWCVAERSRLSQQAIDMIEQADEVFVSIASFWEMAIKQSIGKLDLDMDLATLGHVVSEAGYDLLPIKVEHTVLLTTMPMLHRDPFDRMLIAQSLAEPLRLLTADSEIAKYGGNVVRI